MASIVADILHSTGKLEKKNVAVKVHELREKMDEKKLEVHEVLKNVYINLVPEYERLENATFQIKHMEKEYNDLHDHIEKEIKPQMVNYVTVFKDVGEDLKRVKKLKSAALNLAQLAKCLSSSKSNLEHCFYLKAAQQLSDFGGIMKKLDLEDENDINVFNTIKVEFLVTREKLIYCTENLWREKVCIFSTLEGKKKCHSIKFSSISEENDRELLFTLSLLNQLKPMLKEFGQQFLNVICNTVLLKTVATRKSSEGSSFHITVMQDHLSEPSKAFKVLLDMFNFMNEQFFQHPVNQESPLTALKELGSVIGDEFCSLVIEKCLKAAIPSQSNQLEAFHKEILAAKNFCSVLQELEFLPASNKLLTFLHDVDVCPINKMAQNLLSQARKLMKESLHQTVIVGSEIGPTPEEENVNSLNEMAQPQQGLSKFTFSFPRCQISASMKKLEELFRVAKQEAKNIASPHAIRLYDTCRNICDLYMSVVPTYHKEKIKNIPQQTAIFHNNCMYLAHYLGILSIQLESDLQQVLNVPMQLVFMDLEPEIRKIGMESFLAQMRKQKTQLLQLLQEQVAYGSIMMDEGSVSKAEKAIRQCLCQLQLLKNVWSEVLPTKVYFKAIGTLFNTCLEEVILRISSMEDIAADVAASLDPIFTIFVKHGPELFKVGSVDKRDFVDLYVSKWFKFQELQIVLSASMKEIVDRWASGKGPLAEHFTSEEVKHLIRALFQNTERRAAALAKIR